MHGIKLSCFPQTFWWVLPISLHLQINFGIQKQSHSSTAKTKSSDGHYYRNSTILNQYSPNDAYKIQNIRKFLHFNMCCTKYKKWLIFCFEQHGKIEWLEKYSNTVTYRFSSWILASPADWATLKALCVAYVPSAVTRRCPPDDAAGASAESVHDKVNKLSIKLNWE